MVKKALESLDQKIFRLHGKLVEKANKAVGWNKWDCAHATNFLSYAGWVGGYGYFAISDIVNEDAFTFGVDVIVGSMGVFMYRSGKVMLRAKEGVEEFVSMAGVAIPPSPGIFRLLPYVVAGTLAATGMYLHTYVVPELSEPINITSYLGWGALTQHFATVPSREYFSDQPPNPRNKDNVYSRLKDKVKGWFSSKEPVLEGVNYSVEDIVNGN